MVLLIIFSLTILIVILLILVEMPVGFAFGFGALFYGFTSGIDVSYHATYGMAQVGSFSLLALPLFVMAGTLMGICGISERLLNFIDAFVGRTKGGLGVVTVIACALFGAISGSAAAAIAAIGKIMAPRMIKNGYDPGYVTGLIAVSSVLAFLIPPSIPMIVFAIATRQSVAECFLSTMFPGILLTMLYCFLNIFFLRHDMNIKVAPKKGNKEIWREIVFTGKRAVWAIVMPVLILGGIYSGICSPTEAGAVGVVYTLIVGKFVFKALSVKDVFDATLDAATIVGSVIVILFFLFVMSRGMVLASIPGQFADLLLGLSDNRIVILLIVNLLLFIMGMVIDDISGGVLAAIILMPVMQKIGVHPLHFAAIVGTNLGLGNITPPCAPLLYMAGGVTRLSLHQYVWHATKFLLFGHIPMVFLVTFVPQISLFLPLWYAGR